MKKTLKKFVNAFTKGSQSTIVATSFPASSGQKEFESSAVKRKFTLQQESDYTQSQIMELKFENKALTALEEGSSVTTLKEQLPNEDIGEKHYRHRKMELTN